MFFGKKEVYLTYDVSELAKVRDALAQNGVDYDFTFVKPNGCKPEYKVYVKKKYADYARYIIAGIKR